LLENSSNRYDHVFFTWIYQLRVVHDQRPWQGGHRGRLSGGQQAQRRDGGGENFQSAFPYATAGSSDARVRSASESEAREYCQAFGHRRRARGTGQGHSDGIMYWYD